MKIQNSICKKCISRISYSSNHIFSLVAFYICFQSFNKDHEGLHSIKLQCNATSMLCSRTYWYKNISHTRTHITHDRDRTRYAQHTTNLPPLEKYHQLVRVTIKQNNTRDKVHQYIPRLLLSPPYWSYSTKTLMFILLDIIVQ